MENFFTKADFGYVKEQRQQLTTFCHPNNGSEDASSLECTKYTRFCRGKNIVIDFRKLNQIQEPMRYRDDVLDDGMIGGHGCRLEQDRLLKENGHKSPLQSWFEEIEHFTVFDQKPKCDVTISKPTIIVKLDATVNLYHHFCDFVNLYLSMHVNNSFNFQNTIMLWDTIPYRSNFGLAWKAFTDNPITDLQYLKGKKVCFKDVMFPLLPRMVFGMYYNMPLVPGCHGSGVFHAFNRHLLYRMNITDTFQYEEKDTGIIRITFLSRKTKFRRILNEDELITTLKKKSRKFKVTKVDFNHQMPFEQQVNISANSDILIGIHGAGLTHSLFLPDYAVLFEIYNCQDELCYQDLARLRGVKYLTWEKSDKIYPEDEGKHPELGPHKKFTNYRFDPQEFLRLVMTGVKHVRYNRQVFASNLLSKTNKKRDELWSNGRDLNRFNGVIIYYNTDWTK